MKHEAIIRRALDGEKIQFRQTNCLWQTFEDKRLAVSHMASEYPTYEYRVAPPPDQVEYLGLLKRDQYPLEVWVTTTKEGEMELWKKNPRYFEIQKRTIDGETGKVKSVEIVYAV